MIAPLLAGLLLVTGKINFGNLNIGPLTSTEPTPTVTIPGPVAPQTGPNAVSEAPLPPVGTHGTYQKAVYAVIDHLARGDFAEARRLLDQLPGRSMSVWWELEGLTPGQRSSYTAGIREGLEIWRKALPGLEFVEGRRGGLEIVFTERLPVGEESGLPQGLVLFFGDGQESALVEGVLATRRLASGVQIERQHVATETAYLIGAALGLERAPRPGSVMFRTDGLGTGNLGVDQVSLRLAREVMALHARLEQAVSARERLRPSRPEAFVTPQILDTGEVVQGTVSPLQFEIVNRGEGVLRVGIRPDCACFRLSFPTEIAPGQVGLVSVLMDSTEFQGPQDKGIFVYTNDPAMAVTRVSARSLIRPVYQFLATEGQGDTVYVDESGGKARFYLLLDQEKALKPVTAQVSGASGVAQLTPWTGQKRGKQVSGYVVDILLSPAAVDGRIAASLAVETTDQTFKWLQTGFFVQRGVAASPRSLFLGDMQEGFGRGWVILTGRGSFRVTGVEPQDPRIKAWAEEIRAGEYKLAIEVQAAAGSGDFLGSVVVLTDDPAHPRLVVPVQGTAR